MQLKWKKICILITILVYCATFLLQSNLVFFQTWAQEKNIPRVNIVTILVDNQIYSNISGEIKWYASDYIQWKLSDTKALVIPLDLKNISAYDIYRMMENIYFDWLEKENSSLIGLVMIWDIPFPVVNQDWYIFPTVYPYVDFEGQKYVWDAENDYFISNGNEWGQAEIWHWLINYWTNIDAYKEYFAKIQKYVGNPDEFIGTGMWYEDFIAQKEGFLNENYQYYRNKMMFGEDLWYQRYSPLMKKIFFTDSTENAVDIISDLQDTIWTTFEWFNDENISSLDKANEWMHSTKIIQQEIQDSYLADYNDLFSYASETTMRENVFAWWRWIETYENSGWQKTLVSDSDTSSSFIQMKDTLDLGSDTLVWLLQNRNELLEEMIDKKIDEQKYSMDIVVPLSHEEITKTIVKFQCYPLVRRWQNYYFGQYALYIDEPIDLSIYRWTYRNLEDLSWVTYDSLVNDEKNPIISSEDKTDTKLKSIWASYDIFSAQSEWNRWYTMLKTSDDLDIYEENRTVNKRDVSHKWFIGKIKILSWPQTCKEDGWKNTVCESLSKFAQRRWWGASSINLDMTWYLEQWRYILSGYRATDSWRSIYDMGWFQNLQQWEDEDEWLDVGTWWTWWIAGTGTGPQWAATSFKAYLKYASPTETQWWRDKNISFNWYVVYTNHEPTWHVEFSTMDFRQLDSDVIAWNDGWVWTWKSANTFYVEKVVPRQKSKCWSEENYTFKTMSSVVKHVSTTDEQINWIDYDKYGDSWSLWWYYKMIKDWYESLDEDIKSIIAENSGTGNVVRLQELQNEITDILQSIKNTEDTEVINGYLEMLWKIVKEDSDIILNIYSSARSLSSDPLQLVLEYIIYSEWQNPDDYHIENTSESLLQIPFLQEWKDGIQALQVQILTDYNDSVEIYQNAIDILKEHQNIWEKIKAELEKIDNEAIDFSEISSAFDTMLSVTSDGEYQTLDKNSVTEKCANPDDDSCAQDFLTLFDDANNMYKNLIKDDNDWDTIVAHAKENTDFLTWLAKKRANEILELVKSEDISEDEIKSLEKEVSLASSCQLSNGYDCDDWMWIASYSDVEIISLYSQWAKWDWLWQITDPTELELLQGVTEHLSGLNILTADRPIDSPRYVSMQSIASNEIKLIYPDLFKVEVYKVIWQKDWYDVHELMTWWEIKKSLVKYLSGKVEEYNKILEEEYNNALSPDNSYFDRVAEYDVWATPTKVESERPYGYFTYDDMLNAIWWEAALDAISEILHYQSLTNKKKLSTDGVSDDLELIKTSFALNDKREYVLQNYLTGENEKSQLVIPNYNWTWYEVAYVNSDGWDYIVPSGDIPLSVEEAAAEARSFSVNRWNELNEKTQMDIECNIPENGKLPIFLLNSWKVSSPWLSGLVCWYKNLISWWVASVSLSFDNSLSNVVFWSWLNEFVKSLWPTVLASFDETKDSLNSRKDSMQEYSDAWDEIIRSYTIEDSRNDIAKLQVDAEKNNQVNSNLSKISKYVKVNIGNVRLSDNNPIGELKIESSADVGNVTVQIFSTGDSCLLLNEKNLCQSLFSYTFNPHKNPFTWLVMTYDHKMWTAALDVRLSFGWANYIRKILVISVDPSTLNNAEIHLEDTKTVAWMLTSWSIIGYDKYWNKINWSLEQYDFSVSQWRFLIDWVYKTWFQTNKFKNLVFDYQAPLDGMDGSTAVIQIIKSDGNDKSVIAQYVQKIVQASPEVKLNWSVIMDWNQLNSNASLTLTSDENIYKSDGSVNVSKLNKLEIKIKDLKWNVVNVDSQINVLSRNGLVKVGQVNWTGFYERSKMDIKSWEVTVYYYSTTIAWDDVIYIQIPWLDKRTINLSVLPAAPYAVQIEVPDDKLPLWDTMTAEIMVADKWGNLVKDPVAVSFEYDEDKIESSLWEIAEISNWYSKFTLKGLDAGYAYIIWSVWWAKKGYAEFTVDKILFPTDNLNIMYLNYFWDDRWNQWWYFSDNNQYVENMMMKSKKIITTTTQLVSEDKIKKMVWKIDPGFQIWNPYNTSTTLSISAGRMSIDVWDITEIKLAFPSINSIQTTSLDSVEDILSKKYSDNMVFFVPDKEWYVFEWWVIYSGKDIVVSINQGHIFYLSDAKVSNGDNIWDVKVDWIKIWNMVFHLPQLLVKTNDFSVPWDRYLIRSTFTKWSTAKMQSVWVFDGQSNFELNSSYKSIQNSDELQEKIWFLWDFKNITLFGEGEIVWEATRKFWSEFVINLWDPVLSRKSNNDMVYWTNFDGWIWQEIYADSENDIAWTYQIDFNNDWLKDLLVVYLDWTIKLAKNYDGNPDLRNMQELMRLAVGISEVYIWDSDGNGYDDILIRTKNNQLRVYLNNNWIFDVDGVVACLNTNVNDWEKSSKPSDLSWVYQLFVEDMDQDWKIDIITNDYHGYIKIFYGGTSSAWFNYLSTEKYACDTWWYTREIWNTETVIGLWLTISNWEKIYDNSMMRWSWLTQPVIEIQDADLERLWITTDKRKYEDSRIKEMITPKEGNKKETNSEIAVHELTDKFDVDKASSVFSQDLTKYQDITLLENELAGNAGQNYTFIPISYLDDSPLSEDKALVWKTYSSNGGVLQPWDKVTVTVTIMALKSFSQWTFWDIIQWPWKVYYDNKHVFKWIKFLQNQRNAEVLQRDGNFNYLIDNISLSAWQSLVYQYELEYANVPFTKINITYKTFYSEDDYPDIKLQSTDGCVKNFDVFLWNGSRSHQWQWIYLEDKIAEYYSLVDWDTEDQVEVVDNVKSNVNSLPGIVQDKISRIKLLQSNMSIEVSDDNEGKQELINLLEETVNDAMTNWVLDLSFDVNIFKDEMDEINSIVDDITKWMCNWFNFGWSNTCQWLPVPFNQAFLAPGKYHLFGCRDLPLWKLESWLPIFYFPGTIYAPTPVPMVDWLKSELDDFIWVPGWNPAYTSWIRIYAAPTLTNQLGIAICISPERIFKKIPSPLSDVAWNCIVFAIKPQCKNKEKTQEDKNNPNETFNLETEDVWDSWICANAIKGLQVTENWWATSPLNASFNWNSIVNVDVDNIEITEEELKSILDDFDKLWNKSCKDRDCEWELSPSEHWDNVMKGRVETFLVFWKTRNVWLIRNAMAMIYWSDVVEKWIDDVYEKYFWDAKLTVANPSYSYGGRYSSSFLWIVNMEIDAVNWANEDSLVMQNSIYVGSVDILWWDFDVNKIRAGLQLWIKKLIIDKWLDPQIRYIATQLTQMHVSVILPDMESLIWDWSSTNDLINNFGNVWSQWRNDVWESLSALKWIGEWWESLGKNSSGQRNFSNREWSSQQLLDDFNREIANPFESLASLMSQNNLVNIMTEPIIVKVPMIFPEDINAYAIYLQQWVDINKWIIEDWESALEIWYKSCDKNSETEQEKAACYQDAKQKFDYFVEFESNEWVRMLDQVNTNMLILQKYRDFPFEIYEWIHVIDRYMAEISSLISDTLWYLSYWTRANANRIVWYIDAITLIMNIIKTYQIVIDFSINRSENCGNCTEDTYDQYSCKLALLCESIELPIIQIPNFKLPNITIDLSDIDLWLDIVLPEFNFQTVRIDLPDISNLPEPPSVSIDLNVFDLPQIPQLPEPPTLPDLPSFIPEIELDLPMIPPAPELPVIPNEIKSLIDVANIVWKIYCIVKGKFWLVWESSVKAKIEQLTERTYEVPWIDKILDLTNLSAAEIKNYGVDYEISTHVDFQFELWTIYDYLNAITTTINNISTSVVEVGNESLNVLSSATFWASDTLDSVISTVWDVWADIINNVWNGNTLDIIGWSLKEGGQDIWDIWGDTQQDIKDDWKKVVNDGKDLLNQVKNSLKISYNTNDWLSNSQSDFLWLTSDEVEYADYHLAKERLQEVLTYFKFVANDTSLTDRINSSIKKIENQMNTPSVIDPNEEWVTEVKNQVLTYLDEKKSDYDELAYMINNDYEWFLAMLDEQDKLWDTKSFEDEGKVLAFNTNLFNVDSSTQESLKTLSKQNPYHDLLENKKDIMDWYWNAINTNTADTLWISQSQYLVLRNAIWNARKDVAGLYQMTIPAQSTKLVSLDGWLMSKTLIAADSVDLWSDLWEATVAKMTVDPSGYAQWIFEKMLYWVEEWTERLVKVVHSNTFTEMVGDKHYKTNQTDDHDIILRTENAIYKKCMWWKCWEGSSNSSYYVSAPVSEIPYKETWLSFGQNVKLKIADWDLEVKNWVVQWQTFDNLSLSWQIWNSTGVYLIKLVERIDYSYEKADYNNSALPRYVLALPEWMEIDNEMKIELINKVDSLKNMLWNEIVEVVYYDKNKTITHVRISNVDRKWYYARIAILSDENWTFMINSPWSNQIVAGKQLLWDNQPPIWEWELYRTSIGELVDKWDELDGFVWTNYALKVKRKDNAALSRIEIWQNGLLKAWKDTIASEDEISVSGIFHTNTNKEVFQTIWIDQEWNVTEKEIQISFDIPEITIVDVQKAEDAEMISITAELSQDIDRWEVSFQRQRWEIWKTMMPINATWPDFSLSPKKVFVTGEFTAWNDIAFYDKNDELMALMNPDTAEIVVQTWYENMLEFNVKVEDSASIEIYNKETNSVVFSIVIPTQTLVKYEVSNIYKVDELAEGWNMWMYNGWKVVHRDGQNILYIAPNGHLYSDYSLEWTYSYDREQNAIKLVLHEFNKENNQIIVWLKVEPFVAAK